MLNYHEYLLILLSVGLSLMVHYLIIELTHRKGIFLDIYDKVQKAHTLPTPRIGGLGIFLSCMFIIQDNTIGAYLMLSSIPAFIAGFLEDYSGKISPSQRLAIMLLSPIMILVMLPISIITQIGGLEIGYFWGIAITLLLSLTLVNGVNFTDGQNGIASGSILVSLIGVLLITHQLNIKSLFYISIVIAFSIAVFMVYNLPKGKIFLGDGGAYFIGYVTSIILILLYQEAPQISPFIILVLSIHPIWEVAFSSLRKIFFDKISPFSSDKYHIHQLIYRNIAHSKGYLPAVILLPIQLALVLLSVYFMYNTLALCCIIIMYILIYVAFYVYLRKIDMKRMSLLHKSM